MLFSFHSAMPVSNKQPPFDFPSNLLDTFAVNEEINQRLLKALPEGAWRAELQGGKGRKIAEIFAHIHNVRLMWLKASGCVKMPEKLDRLTCTPAEVQAALHQSALQTSELIRSAFNTPGARIKNFPPNAVHFVGYLITHDAHHRGQICMLARQAGHALLKSDEFGMWEWNTVWKSL